MGAKLFVLSVLLAAVAAGLLVLRQQRLELAHAAAVSYGQIQVVRREIWDLQVGAAYRLRPAELRQRLARTGLALAPALPPPQPPALAQAPAQAP